jgi:hypothetical protein
VGSLLLGHKQLPCIGILLGQMKTESPAYYSIQKSAQFQSLTTFPLSSSYLQIAFREEMTQLVMSYKVCTGGGRLITRSDHHKNASHLTAWIKALKYVAPDASVTFRHHTFSPPNIHLTACHVI